MNKYRWSMLFGTGQFKVRSGSLPAPFRGIYAEQMNLSGKKAGNKADEHNPKCNFCTQNDAFFANIHTAIFIFFDAIFYKSGNDTQRNAKQKKPTANKTREHVQYGAAPLHERRGQHPVITILQHHIKTAVFHSFYLRFVYYNTKRTNVKCLLLLNN